MTPTQQVKPKSQRPGYKAGVLLVAGTAIICLSMAVSILTGDEDQPEPSAIPAPTDTMVATETPEPTDTPSPSPTPEPTDTPAPTNTPTATATTEPTSTPEPTTAPEVVSTAQGDFGVPGTAFMDGREPTAEPPLTLMIIHIWDAVPRQSVVCELAHGTEVDLLSAQFQDDEGRYYFELQSGTCKGWVSEPFLSQEYQEPVGDEFP